ncbi:hypothetical protein CRYUN_Cryun23aG0033400 [Craigia yunnanensis]
MEHFGAKKQTNVENQDESKQQAEPCKQKKRGRPPNQTEEERKKNKIQRDRNYRKDKKAKHEKLEKRNEELEKKEAAHLSEINSLIEELSKARDQQKQSPYEREKRLEERIKELEKEKEADLFKISSLNKELSEIKARADKLLREVSEMSDESKKVKMAGKVLESEMLQLQQNILDSDDQLNSLEPDMLGDLSALLDPQSSNTKEFSFTTLEDSST